MMMLNHYFVMLDVNVAILALDCCKTSKKSMSNTSFAKIMLFMNLNLSKMNSLYSPKEKKKKRRNKGKRGEKKRRKAFNCALIFEKSTLCDLLKTYLSIPLFIN